LPAGTIMFFIQVPDSAYLLELAVTMWLPSPDSKWGQLPQTMPPATTTYYNRPPYTSKSLATYLTTSPSRVPPM
jgi:hypothetical protein